MVCIFIFLNKYVCLMLAADWLIINIREPDSMSGFQKIKIELLFLNKEIGKQMRKQMRKQMKKQM